MPEGWGRADRFRFEGSLWFSLFALQTFWMTFVLSFCYVANPRTWDNLLAQNGGIRVVLQQLPGESLVCHRLVPDRAQKTVLRFWEVPVKLALWQGSERQRCRAFGLGTAWSTEHRPAEAGIGCSLGCVLGGTGRISEFIGQQSETVKHE